MRVNKRTNFRRNSALSQQIPWNSLKRKDKRERERQRQRSRKNCSLLEANTRQIPQIPCTQRVEWNGKIFSPEAMEAVADDDVACDQVHRLHTCVVAQKH